MEQNLAMITIMMIMLQDVISSSVALPEDSNMLSVLTTSSSPSMYFTSSTASEESTMSGTEQITLSSVESFTTMQVQETTGMQRMQTTSNDTWGTTSEQINTDISTVPLRFNCLRPRANCEGDGSRCSPENATCQCAEGRQGFDCSLLPQSLVAACDPPCLNGGTCYSKPLNDTDSIYQCYCTEAFYGDSCQKERVYHKCNPDSMEMHVAPVVGSNDVFVGSVYVKGYEHDPNCVFTASTNDQLAFVNNIQFTACGEAENITDMLTGMTSLSWRVIVRYDDVLLETDQELTFSCYFRQLGNTYEWHAWMVSNDNMINSQLPSRSVSSDVQPVLMSLETLDGKPVVGPQQLGTSLQLKYTLNGGNVYDSFRIEKIAVSNALTGAKRHVFNLVADSCVTEDAWRVKKVVQSLERPTAAQVFLKFKVFKLRYSNQLVFENVIKACRSGVDCQPIECQQGVSRKKRSVNDTNGDHHQITNGDVNTSGHRQALTIHNGSLSDLIETAVYKKSNATLTVWDLGEEHNDGDCTKLSSSSSQGRYVDGELRNIVFIVVAISLIVAIVIVVSLVVGVVCFRLLRKH